MRHSFQGSVSPEILKNPQVYLSEADPILNEIIELVEEPVVESTNDVFFDLVSCIIEQQIHYRAKGVYLKKLLQLLNDEIPTPNQILRLDPYDFVLKKISSLKYKALINLSKYWLKNELSNINWHVLNDDQIKIKLLPIKGVGEWSVDMILLYTLDRPNVFNPNDFQLKKVMSHCYGLTVGPQLRNEMISIAKRWIPFQSLAVKYLLAWRRFLMR